MLDEMQIREYLRRGVKREELVKMDVSSVEGDFILCARSVYFQDDTPRRAVIVPPSPPDYDFIHRIHGRRTVSVEKRYISCSGFPLHPEVQTYYNRHLKELLPREKCCLGFTREDISFLLNSGLCWYEHCKDWRLVDKICGVEIVVQSPECYNNDGLYHVFSFDCLSSRLEEHFADVKGDNLEELYRPVFRKTYEGLLKKRSRA